MENGVASGHKWQMESGRAYVQSALDVSAGTGRIMNNGLSPQRLIVLGSVDLRQKENIKMKPRSARINDNGLTKLIANLRAALQICVGRSAILGIDPSATVDYR